jgi:tetratricopeptide (TPR) repeat protein
MDYSVECFLERSVRYKPDDTIARSLYAQYLGTLDRKSEAAVQLDIALQYAGDNPFTHYNIGLVFFEIGAFDRALQQAHKARELGLPKPELEDQLKKEGQWKDPAP